MPNHFTLSQASEYTPPIDALHLEDLSEHYISIHNSIPSSFFPSDFQTKFCMPGLSTLLPNIY